MGIKIAYCPEAKPHLPLDALNVETTLTVRRCLKPNSLLPSISLSVVKKDLPWSIIRMHVFKYGDLQRVHIAWWYTQILCARVGALFEKHLTHLHPYSKLAPTSPAVADEDWRGAVGATNTGIVMVRNCEWSKYFFQEMLNMQENRSCGSNEQACFRGAYGRNLYNVSEQRARVVTHI